MFRTADLSTAGFCSYRKLRCCIESRFYNLGFARNLYSAGLRIYDKVGSVVCKLDRASSSYWFHPWAVELWEVEQAILYNVDHCCKPLFGIVYMSGILRLSTEDWRIRGKR